MDGQVAGADFTLGAVDDAVFQNGLHGQLGQAAVVNFLPVPAVQNQINPHFLYNTLESIRSEALTAGLTALADMTEALASFFRYTISKVENLVSVEEELQNCETYFKIQR